MADSTLLTIKYSAYHPFGYIPLQWTVCFALVDVPYISLELEFTSSRSLQALCIGFNCSFVSNSSVNIP